MRCVTCVTIPTTAGVQKISADLFVVMTNYVCYNHNWEGGLMPSNWLDVECSNDQRKVLNPTPGYV